MGQKSITYLIKNFLNTPTRQQFISNTFKNFYLWSYRVYLILIKKNSLHNIENFKSLLNNTAKLISFMHYCQKLAPQPVRLPHPERCIDVSIIIPVYNQWNYTRACLNSILATCDDSVNYELILADDCSTDETSVIKNYFRGIQVIKTEKNMGFLRNCNHAAQRAKGRYILLLNNDTIVLPDWLTSLYNTLESNEDAVIAGSKLLNANGTIQQAGSKLFPDGRATLMGKHYPRHAALYNIESEVDYVSGCSMLIRKSFWDVVEGFDEHYCDAYYEDSDLAMQAWSRGMKVLYQPLSEVIHFKHKSYSAKFSSLLQKNQQLFLKKWG